MKLLLTGHILFLATIGIGILILRLVMSLSGQLVFSSVQRGPTMFIYTIGAGLGAGASGSVMLGDGNVTTGWQSGFQIQFGAGVQ